MDRPEGQRGRGGLQGLVLTVRSAEPPGLGGQALGEQVEALSDAHPPGHNTLELAAGVGGPLRWRRNAGQMRSVLCQHRHLSATFRILW